MPRLDLITVGRSSVDLYRAQIGDRLEDMASFDTYIGGSRPVRSTRNSCIGGP